jgi:hypothetical protein
MKIITFSLVLAWCLNVYSSDLVERIYEQASEIVRNNDDSDTMDEELLFHFYSNEIAKMDLEILKKNPELLFRRGVAGLESPGPSISEIIDRLSDLQQDFQFVVDYSEKGSRLRENKIYLRCVSYLWRIF